MKKKTAAKPALLTIVLNALDDLKAQTVVTLDVSRLTDVTDKLVIASGSSNRQVRALAEHAMEEAKKNGMPAMGVEGLDAGEWVLVDFGDIVLHVMQPETRAFYDLERLWQAPEPTQEKAKPASKTVEPKKPARAKKATDKPSTTRASKKDSDDTMETQGSSSRARKSPPKPKAAATTSTKKSAGKSTTAKAGVYAKTGIRKPAATKKAPGKAPAAKKPAPRKPAAR